MTTTAAASATPEPLRALWLTETYPPSRGGMAQSCDRIVRGLRRAGVLVDVLHFVPTARGFRPWVLEEQAGGRYLSCAVEDDPAHALNRAWATLQAQPVAYTHVVAFGGSRPIMAGPVLAAWLGAPLITLIRGNDFDAAVFSIRRRPVLDDALRRSALVIANSRSKVERIAAMHPETTTRWIPNGIEREWALAPSDRAHAAAWREGRDRLTLGLFGQLKAKKGGVFLLDALLRSGVADRFHLLLAGWMAPDMEAWLAEHELEHTALPFLDRYELLPWYAACDFLAIPSFYDGLPNVLVEAAALGVPMIAARVDGMADVLADGETAFLFEPGDEPRAAWALQRAARLDAAGRERMAEACRELARTTLDGDREIAAYVEALHETRATRLAAVR
ncbi:glycosyltransferase family 4 protein [Solirubrobacter sp. CPCC 204708]|uniref:Glycosyltransferase family 4 protein n=1 Tax=Solirubrobacter deserti TaxID=2282478 RepID=A0ABT4RCG6_9ACTN|nr:glycosyltransferase family 4 protein [Solirubrobacter deserti]MBE2315583.1 glycosyltransferase family 4 protein [Solirubrobacter deserti]MDA0136222.1 glycosyltransferase family 4 protein [Solirubrobacter deserti]